MLLEEGPDGIRGFEGIGGFTDHELRQLILAARPDMAVALDDGEADFGGVAVFAVEERCDPRRGRRRCGLSQKTEEAHPGGDMLTRGGLCP